MHRRQTRREVILPSLPDDGDSAVHRAPLRPEEYIDRLAMKHLVWQTVKELSDTLAVTPPWRYPPAICASCSIGCCETPRRSYRCFFDEHLELVFVRPDEEVVHVGRVHWEQEIRDDLDARTAFRPPNTTGTTTLTIV